MDTGTETKGVRPTATTTTTTTTSTGHPTTSNTSPSIQNTGKGGNATISHTPNAQDPPRVRGTALFKVLNPELYFSPKRAVYVPGTLLFLSIVGYFAYDKYFNDQTPSSSPEPASLQPRQLTYLEKLELIKNEESNRS
ncbi:hypothetical protein AYI68_g1110 [Smittium mucronatum]|uniref:Uncharacterized protein n=1 Tax=Smittium mucronatum TaxID=133383 RepID=A0A1R0H6K4_9FUNG|nr:hypothetical protein AYI68_g1110 [Smittium mucronatum]